MLGKWSVDSLLVYEMMMMMMRMKRVMMRMMSGMKCVPGGPGLSLTLCTAPPRTQKSPFIIQQICIFCQNYNLMEIFCPAGLFVLMFFKWDWLVADWWNSST